MERVPEEPVPIDSPNAPVDGNIDLAARQNREPRAAPMAGTGKQEPPGSLNHRGASRSIADPANTQETRRPCKMQHVSFDLACANGLGLAPFTDAAAATLDIVLGRRR